MFYTKLAYGVRCIEIAFGREDLNQLFLKNGLTVVKAFEIGKYDVPTTHYKGRMITFLCSVTAPTESRLWLFLSRWIRFIRPT